MSNLIIVEVDVLATNVAEIKKIELALEEPSEEQIAGYAKMWNKDPADLFFDIKEIVAFERTRKLGFVQTSVNKARRFGNSFRDGSSGLVWSHVRLVSRDFPKAIFLAHYWDEMGNYAGKVVIHAGDEIRHCRDAFHAQAQEWVLPNIFAPYQTEYELGLEFGSLWNNWVDGMRKAVEELAGDDKRFRPARPSPNRNPDDRCGGSRCG